MEYRHRVGLTIDRFAHIAMALIWQWQNGYLDSFANLYTKMVAKWGNLDWNPADGVYLYGHDLERYENQYVVVDLPPRVVIDPSNRKQPIKTDANLDRELLNKLINALRCVYLNAHAHLF